MNVTIPREFVDALNQRAHQRHVPVEELVRQAVAWYLQLNEELLDELSAWQDVRDEALGLIEGDPR
jgi:hypothetical protein